jgi:hypothetical protein
MRARSAVEQLDARLRTAKRDGTLGYFNREFRQRRLQAQAEGRSFMPYAAAKAGLRKALGKVAAGEPGAIMREVFGLSLTPNSAFCVIPPKKACLLVAIRQRASARVEHTDRLFERRVGQ